MNIKHYILEPDGTTRAVDLMTWARWFEGPDRIIARYDRDGYWVSTVFLGIDHNWGRKGPPVLFETMVFDDVREERKWPDSDRVYHTVGGEMACERYCTKDDALIGHERHVRALNKLLDDATAAAEAVTKGTVKP